ncbi:MAG TPA: TA system VapC family ribonuclease toxin [Gemmatimonadales bacterium]|nr:TA system VapC family ribonuclease toxin [Gemmatimonadales bacterium]
MRPVAMVNLCDSNVWLALSLSGHAHHALAREWLDGVDEASTVLFCRSTQQSFLRLLTNAAVLAPYGNPPLTNREAWQAYEAFLADYRIGFRAEEPAGLEARWKELAGRDDASPKLWMDAYLAALALSAGYRMVTTDAAFRQFAGLDLLLLTP